MALFPLGPRGAARIEGRGEGSIAVLFDEDQPAIGFLLHAAYPAPMGHTGPPRGAITLTAYARNGQSLGQMVVIPGTGVERLAWRRAGLARDVAGFTIENIDPGGIALDDILYAKPIPLG
ncbi:hypothetical protein [Rhodalgimonas zhirmunskyi]|uniref:Uncharacterized protein n=1 Tax=Rhodalgimonas zhirmunskyi TaxID=2964767 RepID=A0AAJ1U6B2_9RHOB|nr:hypothetical protein [Rhodoalgimonas zhirmunskyi]MDQ2092505.1 hypothetical protein [Rhodoalgimonas zhirmunskyi]